MSYRRVPRPVNQALGMAPRFGPLPADQVFPWMAIAFVFYFVFRELFKLDWLWVVLLIIWGCSTWWLLTGSQSWRFLGKFVPVPNWTKGRVRYHSLLRHLQERELASQQLTKQRQSNPSKHQSANVKRPAK